MLIILIRYIKKTVFSSIHLKNKLEKIPKKQFIEIKNMEKNKLLILIDSSRNFVYYYSNKKKHLTLGIRLKFKFSISFFQVLVQNLKYFLLVQVILNRKIKKYI